MTEYRVGIYIRLSLAEEDTGRGKAESDSVGGQRELIHQFLDRHPQLKNAPRSEFVDDGYTGTNTDRPQFQALMKELRTQYGTAIMLITHDLGVVAEMCDRVIVMYAGQIVEEADVFSLFRNTLHPYTKALMRSIPYLDMSDGDRLEAIVKEGA